MDPSKIEKLIKQGLPGCTVDVQTDGQGHYEALVISSEFVGLRSLRRHQLVYQTLDGLVGTDIHALALKTLTPEEQKAAD
ncbi:MAG: BolA family transcriptional regulator [Rhodospirillaceae bacterium]|nr:BolA family transcriptional regulator [Rhodospirillaceae bacterium]|tara:strand:- start:871 stop:1110 length:240 start_codon:yes stop_codon:yes gene_type:complete